MARVKEFDPDDERNDKVHEDGETHADPTVSIELTPVRKPPRVSMTQARAAANMRFSGAPWHKIADYLGYKDPATARAVVEAHIAKAFPDESRESLFRITSERLEMLWAYAADQAKPMRPSLDEYGDELPGMMERNPEQLAYMKIGLDIVGRQMKLHGLEAPTQIQVSPDLEKFEDVVQRMVSEVRGERGDVAIEVDVVEYAELEEGDLDA